MRAPAEWNLPLAAFTMLVLVTVLAPPAQGGGGTLTVSPEEIRSDWATAKVDRHGDIVDALTRVPHDPNLLGVSAAHLRTSEYPLAFRRISFPAADGTPLAARIAVHHDSRPRPGVVLVPGMAQTKDQKFVVEVAELFSRNGWHVLSIDLRGHGESRNLSPAMTTLGWKETEDVLGAARYLREHSRATSVAVMGFSMGGRSLVKAMAQDGGQLIEAGIAVTAGLAAYRPITPPAPGRTPTQFMKFQLDFLGARSFHEYYERAARSYGVDLQTLEAQTLADTSIGRVKKPLLMLYALDDVLAKLQIRGGRHDGGSLSLAYRDSVRDHPYVRTILVDQGNHAGMLYLSDPHWFTLVTLNYFKHWQARELDYVTAAAPALDVLVDGQVDHETATYRLVVRNHGTRNVGPLDVQIELPAGAQLDRCWAGFEGLGRCARAEGTDRVVRWTIPLLRGGKTTAGPLVASVNVSALQPGPFEARVRMTMADEGKAWDEPARSQHVILRKP